MGDISRLVLCVGTSGPAGKLIDALRAAHWDVHHACDLRAANRLVAEHRFDVGVLVCENIDPSLATDLDGFLGRHGDKEWVGCFGAESMQLPCCRDLILAHLFDHHTLPFDTQRVLDCLGHAQGRARLRKAAMGIELRRHEDMIIGHSVTLQASLARARRVAKAGAPVLILGESGSGKELFAQVIHRHSQRSGGPFVAVNCGSIQANLIQSELFGHERGAFTGAVADKCGIFEAADGGTVFLDEIGDLPLDLQANLLRFLQEGTINRVGSSRTIKLNVRVVAATNVDLQKAVASGAFRQDLFYRLNVLPMHLAPLRERREDIELLAQHFFAKFSGEKSARLKGFSRSALSAMEAYSWPGNVRELSNRVRCAMIMAEGKLAKPSDLGFEAPVDPCLQNALDDARLKAEQIAISSSLLQSGRNVASAARQLGVSRMTLYRLMIKHGMNVAR